MPLTINQFANGDVVTADSVRTRLNQMEKFINGGIAASDLQSASAWVDSDLIVRPEFYGSPAPRMLGVTADVHHRTTGNPLQDSVVFYEDISNDYLVVPGLAASFHVPATASLSVLSCFFTYEIGAEAAAPSTIAESVEAAKFRLFVDGTARAPTQRSVYANNDGDALSRKQHAICYHHSSTLSPGVHSVSIRMKVLGDSPTTGRTFKKIYVKARNLIINLQYL